MAKRSMLAVDSVLVVMRPNCYYRDRSTGRTYTGGSGRPGSPKHKEGSPPFRVSRVRFERDVGLPDPQRIFNRVGEADEPIDA